MTKKSRKKCDCGMGLCKKCKKCKCSCTCGSSCSGCNSFGKSTEHLYNKFLKIGGSVHIDKPLKSPHFSDNVHGHNKSSVVKFVKGLGMSKLTKLSKLALKKHNNELVNLIAAFIASRIKSGKMSKHSFGLSSRKRSRRMGSRPRRSRMGSRRKHRRFGSIRRMLSRRNRFGDGGWGNAAGVPYFNTTMPFGTPSEWYLPVSDNQYQITQALVNDPM